MKYFSYKIGNIIKITDVLNNAYKHITIAKDSDNVYTHTIIVYSEQTLVLDSDYTEISVDELKIGDLIVAFYSNTVTTSVPPQAIAYVVKKMNRD